MCMWLFGSIRTFSKNFHVVELSDFSSMFWINCIYRHQLITFTIMDKCFRATWPFLFLNRFFFHTLTPDQRWQDFYYGKTFLTLTSKWPWSYKSGFELRRSYNTLFCLFFFLHFRDISVGEEILYDYGVKKLPWDVEKKSQVNRFSLYYSCFFLSCKTRLLIWCAVSGLTDGRQQLVSRL